MRHLPNALCILRMLLLVPVAWLLHDEEYRLTLAVLGVAAATDALDGFLARRFGWMSELGRILDPLADKILLVGVFITLGLLDIVPMWLALTAVARDVVITAGAIAYNRLYGNPRGRPTVISKLNTACQVLYLLLVVAHQAGLGVSAPVLMALGALVLVTTVVSGLDYVLTYSRKAMAENRRRHRPT